MIPAFKKIISCLKVGKITLYLNIFGLTVIQKVLFLSRKIRTESKSR